MRILGVGEAVVDTTILSNSETSTVVRQDAGGPVLSGLILLAKLGADCHMVTSLGSDGEGELVRSLLDKHGITFTPGTRSKTKQHTISVDQHTGQRKKYRDVAERGQLPTLDPEFVQSFDLIIVDRHEPRMFYEIIASKRPDAHLIVDPSTDTSSFALDLMYYSSHPIIPIETLVSIGMSSTIQQSLDKLFGVCAKPFVTTAGEYGSILYDGQSIDLIQPLRLKTVDTCGAGDIFRAGFAYGILQGWSQKGCAEYANTVAALQCTNYGNASVVPDKETIEAHHKHPPDKVVSLEQLEECFNDLRNYNLKN